MRWVVKVGSAVLSSQDGRLDRDSVGRIVRQLTALHRGGHDVLVVSSGAVAAGVGRLGWTEKPAGLRQKQSAASIGQLALMEAYEEGLTQSQIIPAQILLTRDDLLHRHRYLNIRNTLLDLLALRTIPIINENDTVSTEEIQFGDNDTLSAIVAAKVEADKLVLLSNVGGWFEGQAYSSDSQDFVPVVETITPDMEKRATRTTGSRHSVGGMAAKLQAAKMATAAGVETWICSGYRDGVLESIDKGDPKAGTRFVPKKQKVASRHVWIAFGRASKGVIVVDDGARVALMEKRKSLLPSGIKTVRGHFSPGDTVQIKTKKGEEIGRGLVNFGSEDVKKIRGRHSSEIPVLLGRIAAAEVVHRDNLVLLS